MKFITITLAAFVASASAMVAPAPPPGTPACSHPCFINSLPSATGCQPEDLKCLCKSDPYKNAVAKCVMSSCNQQEQLNTLKAVQAACKGA